MSKTVKDEGEETSNLTGIVIQDLIKKLSIPSELIDDNNRGNKIKESKPIILLQLYYNANQTEKYVIHVYQEEIRCWYLFAKKFEERVKEIKNDNNSLHKKTAKARNIYKLFGESYDPDIKKIVKGIGIEKIERI
ncbi:12645_t:CDS:2 [Cetraspora pellucida]|uniref:12645_t:CDS:1 n=1 Tax=Cetraspora pellucida TaxID=1433469 RepID=A0A9N9HSR5_9GLOM|nr:12645_t:CDS:2 [Cetraspora pellucida]